MPDDDSRRDGTGPSGASDITELASDRFEEQVAEDPRPVAVTNIGPSTQRRLTPDAAVNDRRSLMLMSIRDAGERPPLAQEIFDEIAIAIVEGRLRPGDTLNSVDLANRFGTSRTPVREALAELERQGVIVIPRRRRPYIARATLKEIKDVYELRTALFALVSRLVVENCEAAQLAELWEWQTALEKDVEQGSVDNYFWHNVGFRVVETRLSGNEELQRMVSMLGVRTLQYRHLSLSQPGRIQRSAEDHRRLLIAYEERDKETAAAVSTALIMAGLQAIERSGLVPGSRTPEPQPEIDRGRAASAL